MFAREATENEVAEANRLIKAARQREFRRTHNLSRWERFKANCRSYTRMLIMRGLIPQKFECEKCGAKKPERHHPDYFDPWRVEFLCKKCHREHHRKHQESLRVSA